MTTLDKATFDSIVKLLVPYMESTGKRNAFVKQALYDASLLTQRIDYEGDAQQFTVHLVRVCDDFGEITPGQLAVVALLRQLRQEVGIDKQEQIDALLDTIADRMAVAQSTISEPSTPAARAHVFISYSRISRDFVAKLTENLMRAGVAVWIDRTDLEPGTSNWENALRDAIRDAYVVLYIGSSDAARSNYVLAELEIAEIYSLPVIPVWANGVDGAWADSAPMKLVKAQYIDLRRDDNWDSELRALIERLLALQGAPVASPKRQFLHINPYKGLRPFTQDDTAYFFGRDEDAAQLFNRFNEQRFVSVIGASGSGKSSLVMAGILPKLDPKTWTLLRFVPGDHPLLALANILADEVGMSVTEVEKDLKRPDGLGLHLYAERIGQRRRTPRVLIFIDQFEEVFSRVNDEDERRVFLLTLQRAIKSPKTNLNDATEPDNNGRTSIILTMRGDFYDRPMAYPDFFPLIADHYPLLAMSDDRLLDAVVKPAEAVGLTFEDGLIGDLLFEIRGEAGALPLMQFTLDLLYRRCIEDEKREKLTLTAYRVLGGVRGALARYAEEQYLKLNADDQRLARALFLRLIEPGATEQDSTRRRILQSELQLVDAFETERLNKVLHIFVDARLLTTDRTDSVETVEVGHEALIREWGRLQTWLNDYRADVLLGKKINADAAAWMRSGQPVEYGAFYRGTILVDAEEWTRRALPSRAEAAFVTASRADEERLKTENEQRKQELIQAAERSSQQRRRARLAIGFAIIMLVIALSVGILATSQVTNAVNQAATATVVQGEALKQVMVAATQVGGANSILTVIPPTLTQVAEQILQGESQLRSIESQRLAALSEILMVQPDGNDETATLLGIRALTTSDSPEARNALQTNINKPNYGLAVLEGHMDSVDGAIELKDGRLLSWSDDNSLWLWSNEGKALTLLDGHTGSMVGALELKDGRLLSWSLDNTLRLWSSEGTSLAVLEGHTDSVYGALELGDGRLLSWSRDSTLRLWNKDGQALAVLEGHQYSVSGALAMPDGRFLSWSKDSTLRLWSSEGKALAVLAGHRDSVYGAIELKDGRLLSSSLDNTLRLWSSEGASLAVLEGHNKFVYGAIELKDGRLLSWSLDHTLRLWSSKGESLAVLEGHTFLVDGAIELADGRLLSWSFDNTLRVWSNEGKPQAVLEGHTNHVSGALVLPDGRILSWSGDNTLRLWSSEGESLAVLEGHTESVDGAIELKDGRLLSWSGDNTLRLWSSEGKALPVLEGHTHFVNGAIELTDGRLLSWSGDNTLRLWSSEGASLAVLEGHTDFVDGALAMADGRLLSWSEDNTLRLWSSDGASLAVLGGHKGSVVGALELRDGRLLSWSGDNTLRLWSSEGKALAVLEGHTEFVYGAIELADGRFLSWSADGTLRLWNPEGHVLATMQGHTESVSGSIELADGRLLSWSDDGTLRLWSSEGKALAVLEGHTDSVDGSIELADGRLLSWSKDYTLRLWNKDGQALAVLEGLEGHTDSVDGSIELADGRLLSWSKDYTLRLWNSEGKALAVMEDTYSVDGSIELANGRFLSWSGDTLRLWSSEGKALAVLEGHTGSVVGAIELRDGRLLSWSYDGTLRVWYPNATDFIAFACTHVFRDFILEERQEFNIEDDAATCPQFQSY